MSPFTASDARASILEAASAVFAQKGIDGVSMRLIAKEMGVSAPALSHPMHYDVMMIRPHQWALGPDPEQDPEWFAGLVTLVEACQAAGQLRQGDAREAAHRLWAALHGVVSLEIAMPGEIRGLEPDSVRARAGNARHGALHADAAGERGDVVRVRRTVRRLVRRV